MPIVRAVKNMILVTIQKVLALIIPERQDFGIQGSFGRAVTNLPTTGMTL